MTFESVLLSVISFSIGSLLLYFGLSALITHRTKIEDFIIHLNISWVIFGILWIVIGILELFFTINSFSPVEIIKILVFFGMIFLLEFSLFFITLFSNRTSFYELYVPILIGLAFGLNLASIFISNDSFDILVLMTLTIVSILVFIEFLVMITRFRKILEINKKENKVNSFFSKIINITTLMFLASSVDVLIFLAIILDITLLSLASSLIFIFLLGISILFTIENRYIFQIINNLDITLILNEIN